MAVLHWASVHKIAPLLAIAKWRTISAAVVRWWGAKPARTCEKNQSLSYTSVRTRGSLPPTTQEKRSQAIKAGNDKVKWADSFSIYSHYPTTGQSIHLVQISILWDPPIASSCRHAMRYAKFTDSFWATIPVPEEIPAHFHRMNSTWLIDTTILIKLIIFRGRLHVGKSKSDSLAYDRLICCWPSRSLQDLGTFPESVRINLENRAIVK